MTNSDHCALEKREVNRMAEQEKIWPQAERKMKGESKSVPILTQCTPKGKTCVRWTGMTELVGGLRSGPRGPTKVRWSSVRERELGPHTLWGCFFQRTTHWKLLDCSHLALFLGSQLLTSTRWGGRNLQVIPETGGEFSYGVLSLTGAPRLSDWLQGAHMARENRFFQLTVLTIDTKDHRDGKQMLIPLKWHG